jgi:DNA-binding CsgD family transcriptional regulator
MVTPAADLDRLRRTPVCANDQLTRVPETATFTGYIFDLCVVTVVCGPGRTCDHREGTNGAAQGLSMVHEDGKTHSSPCCCGSVHFTEREIEVLRLVAAGLTNRDVAQSLHVSTHTVDRHVGAMLRRSRARNRASMVAVAYAAGILIPGEHPPRPSGRRCLPGQLPGQTEPMTRLA